MPAVSQAQQRLMGMCAHADHPPDSCPNMAKDKMREFAQGKNLPPRANVGKLKGLSHLLK